MVPCDLSLLVFGVSFTYRGLVWRADFTLANTAGIKGMMQSESAPLLNFLFAHQVQPEFTCRFSWQPGSLAFWDNRCVQHNPVNDYHGHRRVMHRITLAGDRPM